MKRFQSGAAKRKEKSMRLENESKGKVTFEQLGWGKSTESKVSELQVQHVQPLADAEEQVIQLCQKELEAVNEVSEKQENDTEAYVLVSHEESMYRDPHVEMQNSWQEVMSPLGIDSAKETGIELLPMVHCQTQKSSQEIKQAESFKRAY